MPILLFTVGPPAVGQLHDMLACLAKFNEDISIESTQTELRISSLNVSKTAYAAFTLSCNVFFEKYHFSPDQRGSAEPKVWACRLQNRALASVFRKRLSDSRENDIGLERCEFELQARADNPECRLVIRLICRLGIVKTYRLTYESGENLHASFDQALSINTWSVSSKTLRDVVEYFGPKSEQLDWYLKDGQVTFTSYTEKVQSGREILKQPMHTSVALKKKDFDDCKLEEDLHIGITVNDFRAIIAHAETLDVNVTARYSRGSRPMQISYNAGGILARFTLMTKGTSKVPTGATTGVTNNTPARGLSVRPNTQAHDTSRAASLAPTMQSAAPTQAKILPDREQGRAEQPSRQPSARQESPPAPSARINEESLFIPADDDDQQWDAPNFDEEPEYVTWDDGSNFPDASASMRRVRDSEQTSLTGGREERPEPVPEIAPTQRLSQVKGLFD